VVRINEGKSQEKLKLLPEHKKSVSLLAVVCVGRGKKGTK